MKQQTDFSIIRRLSNQNLKEHKGRFILLAVIIGIIASFITMSNILSTSTFRNMQYAYIERYGNTSHVLLEGIQEQDMDKIANSSSIKASGRGKIVGDAVSAAFEGRSVQIAYGDLDYAEYALAKPEQGRMPKEEGEAALDTSVLEDLGINPALGGRFTLEWIGHDKKRQSQEFELVGL